MDCCINYSPQSSKLIGVNEVTPYLSHWNEGRRTRYCNCAWIVQSESMAVLLPAMTTVTQMFVFTGCRHTEWRKWCSVCPEWMPRLKERCSSSWNTWISFKWAIRGMNSPVTELIQGSALWSIYWILHSECGVFIGFADFLNHTKFVLSVPVPARVHLHKLQPDLHLEMFSHLILL